MAFFSYLSVEIAKIKPREKLSCQIRGIKYFFFFFFSAYFLHEFLLRRYFEYS